MECSKTFFLAEVVLSKHITIIYFQGPVFSDEFLLHTHRVFLLKF
jgi:hypothetical protein